PLTDLLQEPQDAGAVTEGDDACFHGHPHDDRTLDGIDADVVHDPVGPGDDVQIVNAAVGADPPDGLVFEPGGDVFPLLVAVDLGTLDDAAGVAAVLRLAAALDDRLAHGLAADLVVPVELTVAEVFGGQSPGLVEDVDQDVGAVSGEPLAAHRVLQNRLGKGAGGELKLFRILDLCPGPARVVDGDVLHLLRAHHRPQPATAVTPDVAVRITDRDVGCDHPHLPHRADGEDADLLADPSHQGLDHLVVPLADQFLLLHNLEAVLVDLDAIEFVLSGLPLDDERLDPELRQVLRRGAAGVRLLDGSGQGALGAGRQPSRLRGRGAGQKARCKYQLVVSPQRMAGRGDLLRHDGRGEPPAAEPLPFGRHFLEGTGEGRHVYSQYFFRHDCFLPFF